MAKPKDIIGVMEKKADVNLGEIDAFIEMFQSAQENANDLDTAANAEIARLNEIKRKSKRIILFTERLLTVNKEK